MIHITLIYAERCVFLSCLNFDPSEVYSILVQLDITKASGCDGLHPSISSFVLIFYQTLLLAYLTDLWNIQLFPLNGKLNLIRPIPKSGDKSLVTNYRPISLLCIVSKVLEKAIFNHRHVIQYI